MKTLKQLAPILLLVWMVGCAAKTQTPQYNLAVGINDFTHALKGFQDVEIAAHDSGFVPDSDHKVIQKAVLAAYQYDSAAENAVKTGDLTSAKSQYAAALVLLQGIQPSMVGVKNPTSQQAMKTALAVVIAIAQDWAGVNQ